MMSEVLPTKVCSTCKVEKALTEFNRNKSGKYGHRSNCKICTRLYMKNWNKSNSEREKEKSKNRYINNLEKNRERSSNWRKNNPEKVKEANRNWRKNNREKNNKRIINWRNNNPEKYKLINDRRSKLLTDYFVINRLKLTKDQATPELIELKRTQIIISRAMKEIKRCQKK